MCAFALSAPLFAQNSSPAPADAAQTAPASHSAKPLPPLSFFTLGNGLEVIFAPIPDSARVSLGIVFRGGAEAQTKANAGLFRLLEHLLFRGTTASPGGPEPAEAIEALDPAAIDGGALSDRFALSFLLAPEMLAQGIDTIAYLFSALRLAAVFSDPLTLEKAKSDSLADIKDALSAPEAVYEAAMAKKLFSSAPWRFDIAGSEAVVKAAGEASIKALAASWLVPNNAALIVAGDFIPEQAKTMIDKAFASWKKAADPLKTTLPSFPKPGVTRPALMVYADASLEPEEAVIEMRYRGPDAASSRAAAAALWAEMAARPDARLAAAIAKTMPKHASPSPPVINYRLSKSASWFSVSIKIRLDAKANPADTVLAFKESVRGTEMYAMKTNASYFGAKEYEEAKEAIARRAQDARADPWAAGAVIAEGWILGGSAWLDAWPERVAKVDSKDLSLFADEYFMKNLEVIAIRLDPLSYAAKKKNFDAYGFEAIAAQNAFWWQ